MVVTMVVVVVTMIAMMVVSLYARDLDIFVPHECEPLDCHLEETRVIPSGVWMEKKDYYCLLQCSQRDWCKYLHHDNISCYLYDTDCRPSTAPDAILGYKTPPGPWQPPMEETHLYGSCSTLYYASEDPDSVNWSNLSSIYPRQTWNDCPCAVSGDNNWVAVYLHELHNISTVTLTSSFGEHSSLKNTNLQVGNTLGPDNYTFITSLANVTEEYTDYSFNMWVEGQYITLHRTDNLSLCLCDLDVFGY